jgi:hypothetical protein
VAEVAAVSIASRTSTISPGFSVETRPARCKEQISVDHAIAPGAISEDELTKSPGLHRRGWMKTNIARTHGRFRRGQRLIAKVPHGHWKTLTFVAAPLRHGIVAPCLLRQPIKRHQLPGLGHAVPGADAAARAMSSSWRPQQPQAPAIRAAGALLLLASDVREATRYGTFPNTAAAVEKLVRRLRRASSGPLRLSLRSRPPAAVVSGRRRLCQQTRQRRHGLARPRPVRSRKRRVFVS